MADVKQPLAPSAEVQSKMQIGQLMSNNGQLQQNNGQLIMEGAQKDHRIAELEAELAEAKGETPPPDGGKTNRTTRRATGAKRRQAKKVEAAGANGIAEAKA